MISSLIDRYLAQLPLLKYVAILTIATAFGALMYHVFPQAHSKIVIGLVFAFTAFPMAAAIVVWLIVWRDVGDARQAFLAMPWRWVFLRAGPGAGFLLSVWAFNRDRLVMIALAGLLVVISMDQDVRAGVRAAVRFCRSGAIKRWATSGMSAARKGLAGLRQRGAAALAAARSKDPEPNPKARPGRDEELSRV